ncbi:Asp-tRNA(Asn)/Glu-tRNA(Gln) amidotransferase subunit GatC [Candidatus Micrarchaeota archaeon]|nr:Asp-tRNA(Asn)/Glu-tRNA(Gln) amidotransferase subunit GatC [Candidatus Micrarchaeota archaeon]
MDYKKEVEKLSKTARLKLSEEEKTRFAADLTSVLEAFDKLDEVDTSQIKDDCKKHTPILRKDKAEEKEFNPFSNTKHKKDNYFLGPRLVE